MSSQTAPDNIHLRPCGRWGHTEYSLEYHRPYLAARTGLAEEDGQLFPRAYERFEFDFLWSTNDGLVNWSQAGRTTNMGHAAYAADASDLVAAHESPFRTPEEVWAFDAVSEYGLPDFREQVAAYQSQLDKAGRAVRTS